MIFPSLRLLVTWEVGDYSSIEIFVSPRFSSLYFLLLFKLFGEEFGDDFTTGYGYPSDEDNQGEEKRHYYKVQKNMICKGAGAYLVESRPHKIEYNSYFRYFILFIFSLFTCPGYGSPHNKAYDTEYALAALQNQVFFEERSRYQPINQGVIINQSTNLKTSDVF